LEHGIELQAARQLLDGVPDISMTQDKAAINDDDSLVLQQRVANSNPALQQCV
jgi:hypothetical protein